MRGCRDHLRTNFPNSSKAVEQPHIDESKRVRIAASKVIAQSPVRVLRAIFAIIRVCAVRVRSRSARCSGTGMCLIVVWREGVTLAQAGGAWCFTARVSVSINRWVRLNFLFALSDPEESRSHGRTLRFASANSIKFQHYARVEQAARGQLHRCLFLRGAGGVLERDETFSRAVQQDFQKITGQCHIHAE